MGFLDKIKGAIKGQAGGGNVGRVVSASVDAVTKKSKSKLVGVAEKAAKDIIADIAADIVNAEIDKLDDVPSGYIRDKLVEAAISQVVDKVWDSVKDEIKKAGD